MNANLMTNESVFEYEILHAENINVLKKLRVIQLYIL